MKHYIGCDAHKKYSVFAGINGAGEIIPSQRAEHNREGYRSFFGGFASSQSNCDRECRELVLVD